MASNLFVLSKLVLASLAGLAIYKVVKFPRPEPLDDVELNYLRIWTRFDQGDLGSASAADDAKRMITELESTTRFLRRTNPEYASILETELAFTYELISDMPDDLRPRIFQFYRVFYDVRDVYELSQFLTAEFDPIVFKQIVVAARLRLIFDDDSICTSKGRVRGVLQAIGRTINVSDSVINQIVEQMTITELTEISLRVRQLSEAADDSDQKQFKERLQQLSELTSDLEERLISKVALPPIQ